MIKPFDFIFKKKLKIQNIRNISLRYLNISLFYF